MLNSFSSKIKSLVSSDRSNELDVTFHRKRKRESVEGDHFDGDIEFVSEKKPRLEKTASQSSLLSSVFSTKAIKNMSDWVQNKIPGFNMLNWKTKSKKPALTHGNGQGVHGHHGVPDPRKRQDRADDYREAQGRAEGKTFSKHVGQGLHREALRGAYGNRGILPQTVPQGSYESSQPPGPHHGRIPPGSYSSSQPPGLTHGGMMNGEDPEQSLTRPPLHESRSQSPSECAESIADSSVAGSSVGSRKGVSSLLYRKMFNVKQKEKFTAEESIRLQDKVRYKQLLQQFTTVPLEPDTTVEPKSETVKQPICPTALPRSNDSILGSSTGKSLKIPEKQDVTARPRIKIHPSQRKTKTLPCEPVVNGDRTEDESLLYINDISAIHDSRTNNFPGSSRKVSIDLTEDDDDVQIVSKHKHNVTDYRESKFITEDWIKDLTTQYNSKARERDRQIKEGEIKAKLYDERRKAEDEDLEKRIRRQMQIYKKEPAVTEEIYVEEEEEEEEKEEKLPELTDDMQAKISSWLHPHPGGQVLIDKFRLQITRKDIATLAGLEWLNDEIINFYMNLLMERGEKDGNAKVYAFNTFFYPKILGGGQPAVKRWTRRVDIFAHDYILIPVHLGVHWCLAIVAFKKKQIQYYDSMGGNNLQCLNVIKKYLCDECQEKKKQEFNLQGWSTIVVKDIPQQMNGSDCGMFACKYAEYITRGAPISFTQQHMPYFRRRMVYEIVTGKLLQ